MKIEMKPIDAVTPYPDNPRSISDKAIDAIARSIQTFKFRQPIVTDEAGVIVVGHGRWLAAKRLGLTDVPVHVADLTPAQAKAYRLADNQTNTLAEWDMSLLPLELSALKELDFDLSTLGFDEDEISRLLKAACTEGLCDADAIPEPPAEATTQPGDLWILGQHRLLCGDSASAADVDRLLDGAQIHLVNTDPPYNVRVEPRSNNAIAAGLSSFSNYGNSDPGRDVVRCPEKRKGTTKRLRAKDRPLANDFVSDEAFAEMLSAWFGQIARVLLPGRALYCWGGYSNIANYPPALRANGLYFSQTIIWDKQHPVLSRKDYMGAHECCF